MGYIRHHAIVVTTWERKLLQAAHEKASEIFEWVSPISEGGINGYASFFIPPDGSKEGWGESFAGDERRQTFMNWCDQQAYDDGSSSLDFVEVYYGDDYNMVGVSRANAGSDYGNKKND